MNSVWTYIYHDGQVLMMRDQLLFHSVGTGVMEFGEQKRLPLVKNSSFYVNLENPRRNRVHLGFG